jgi:RHS repeat-associated protein
MPKTQVIAGQFAEILFSGHTYRYAFNGMEKVDEVSVEGGDYDFGARIYDSRLGRWLSVDPAYTKYPSSSSYTFAANSPITLIDPDGEFVKLHGRRKDQIAYVKTMNSLATGVVIRRTIFGKMIIEPKKNADGSTMATSTFDNVLLRANNSEKRLDVNIRNPESPGVANGLVYNIVPSAGAKVDNTSLTTLANDPISQGLARAYMSDMFNDLMNPHSNNKKIQDDWAQTKETDRKKILEESYQIAGVDIGDARIQNPDPNAIARNSTAGKSTETSVNVGQHSYVKGNEGDAIYGHNSLQINIVVDKNRHITAVTGGSVVSTAEAGSTSTPLNTAPPPSPPPQGSGN